jgi:hypothetical protein
MSGTTFCTFVAPIGSIEHRAYVSVPKSILVRGSIGIKSTSSDLAVCTFENDRKRVDILPLGLGRRIGKKNRQKDE